ncbi:MAG: AI-2E family transporter [Candidatus Gracilibacteria bacterium]|nr:AI-2E family transporter [Candidatus Gracilibacteria bacterium]
MIFTLSNVIPKVIDELVGLTDKVPFIKNEVSNIVTRLQDMVALNTEIGGSITEIVNTQDISIFFDIFNKLKSAGYLFFEVLLSILLSYVFIIDRHKLKDYFLPIRKSNFSFFYHEYSDFFERIVKSFGLIFKAQSIIAFVNALLTALGLYFVGMMYNTVFPYFLTLIIFVFICGFIPVLGTFISSIPILFLGYKLGGASADFALLCLVALVHIVEAYYLNPKIVSSFLNLPVSLTFVILLVSERFFGIAGLLVGVSFFYFLEGMLIDADKGINDLIGK